jgi:signal transduction histidine kinase
MPLTTSTFEQIAASLAHEVKNPLSLVKANIDLLELSDGSQAHRKNFTVMRREIERINDLMTDFMQIANPSAPELERVSLNGMLCEVYDSFKTAYRHRIKFCLSFKGSEFTVMADGRRIRQVLYNIVKNSVESIELKAAGLPPEKADSRQGKAGGTIRAELTAAGKYTRITVRDNGKGLTDEQAKRISEPFYTTKRGGSGLGLYFCKSVIEGHGGTLELRGKEGHGCVVTIMLPNEPKRV